MARKQVLVIGLGQFGLALTRSLAEREVDVLAVDVRPERVQAAAAVASEAACFDAVDEEALARAAPASRDVCVCAIGDDAREAAIMVTALLCQQGARRVIARAGDDLLERIMRSVGAHEVVNPERAFGERLARRLLYQGILEEIPFGDDLVMSELRVPEPFVGHKLIDLALPRRFGLTVLGIRRANAPRGQAVERPVATTDLRPGDVLLVVASPGGIRTLLDKVGQ